jgi:hypothetical protein
MYNIDLPVGMHDEDWLPFWGRAEFSGDKALLVHQTSPDRIWVKKVDVYVPPTPDKANVLGIILVRRLSQYFFIEYGPGGPPSERRNDRSSKACSSGSECVSGLEYCCVEKTLVSVCYGRWGCL